MGHIVHHAIVVTSWNGAHIDAAADYARGIGAIVAVQDGETVNGYRTLIVCPDGSKSGWRESDDGDSRRDLFVKYLRDMRYEDDSNTLEWVEVEYGSDDEAAKVTRHEWQKEEPQP